ncbi:hypothetical protein EL22_10655 [Halostagnicola sp. A56]|uniref:hypothetical protein n=1 Tax=Halostagnicola sp. A56 TaxID=1495067 RepID=UPI00049EFC56|nr:hypothetical protein [Halostagnicola sp. A56]KDE57656.1 hypothetical protein EL22_10655 [Halostagnicola sp. A56]
MDEHIGLRIYAAAYITAGVIIGGVGSFFGAIGSASPDILPTILAFAAWAAFFFVAVVVALKGVVVLLEEIVQGTGE